MFLLSTLLCAKFSGCLDSQNSALLLLGERGYKSVFYINVSLGITMTSAHIGKEKKVNCLPESVNGMNIFECIIKSQYAKHFGNYNDTCVWAPGRNEPVLLYCVSA